jgi:glycosyltransferase involved in cell wall biosynthesis
MRVLFIHNDYAKPSGEEHAANALANLLVKNGHSVEWYRKSTSEIGNSIKNKAHAFFSGFYNQQSIHEISKKIDEFKPEIVQLQNLYPFISPPALKFISKKNVPIVMRCPNYRLFCPNSLFLDRQGKVCEKCTGMLKESWCILKNCENSLPKSIGYSLRNFAARLTSVISDNVNVYIVQSEFQKMKFIELGIANNKIQIIPGLTPPIRTKPEATLGNKVSFIGRVSYEKGIYEFIEAARQLPEVPFVIAGRVDNKFDNLKNTSPKNIEWKGFLAETELDKLYVSSRIIVIPSKWYEGFPNVITRAMIHGKPVITSNMGVMSSIIDHHKNGLLTEPGNIAELRDNIKALYNNETKCIEMGKDGKKKAKREYSESEIYRRLLLSYEKAISNKFGAK